MSLEILWALLEELGLVLRTSYRSQQRELCRYIYRDGHGWIFSLFYNDLAIATSESFEGVLEKFLLSF